MSEAEKKKRQGYNKNRGKWIFAQSMIIAVLTLAVLISVLVGYQLNKAYYVAYTQSGGIDYNVFLKENEFFEDQYLGSNQSYVASLIDRVLVNFNYDMLVDSKDVN